MKSVLPPSPAPSRGRKSFVADNERPCVGQNLFAGSMAQEPHGNRPPTPAEEDGPSAKLPPSPAAAPVDDGDEVAPLLNDAPFPMANNIASYPTEPLGPHEEEAGQLHSLNKARIHTYSDERDNMFPRISKPVELMRNSYDIVVIGSGYGGAIAASRMARAVDSNGRRCSVCVLERGKERWPGQYPEKAWQALKEIHVTGELTSGHILPSVKVEAGDPTDMFHLMLGRGMNAIVGNGLGGTSLMNANVFLRADAGTMSLPFWPDEIRHDTDCLEKYYKKVEEVLEPTAYPEDWPGLPKATLFEQQAAKVGMSDKTYRVPLTTRFKDGPNSCGFEMNPSALTGQDATGLNDGSKTTTLVTYLADAWNWGADMFCECEVRYVKQSPGPEGGYIVYFAWHGRKRDKFRELQHGDLMWVHAKKCVFLGAGSLGTTEILLRSKEVGLKVSDRVGESMSGNGDMLAFGYNTDFEANAIGRPNPKYDNPVGPTITTVIDNRQGHENVLDGYVIQEGTIPKALAGFMAAAFEATPGKERPDEDTAERIRSNFVRAGSLMLGPYLKRGAMDHTQVYLVMSHDSSQAIMTLKGDKPVLEFLGIQRSDHVSEINKVLSKMTTEVGGTFINNYFYAVGKQQLTVHPIGGACMARDGTGATGVTNHVGEVFTGAGEETHGGLIVTDGAAIPAALGVNPFATISALAERSVEKYADKHGMRIRSEKNGILNLFGPPRHPYVKVRPTRLEGPADESEAESISQATDEITEAMKTRASGLGFTEVMSGFVHRDTDGSDRMLSDKHETYVRAYRTAKSLCEGARFFLSVQSFDTKSLVNRKDHPAMLTGTFVCPAIPGSPFMVQRGDFGLFVVDRKAPRTRNLIYDFDMRGTDRSLLHFHGYKVVDSSVALSVKELWRATTTLYVTIAKPPTGWAHSATDDPDGWRRGEILAKGIMRVSLRDFAKQIKTMAATGDSLAKRTWSVTSFMTFFARRSLLLFAGPFAPLEYPNLTAHMGYINNCPPNETIVIVARDNVKTRMHIWEPTNKDLPVRNIFMIPGASVDHQIYALPTIPYHAVNYFTRAGYRVFVSVHRICQIVVARNNHTTFDVRLDLRACLEYIRASYPVSNEERATSNPDNRVYTIAHCMGSVALSAGMLDGTIPVSWMQGLTCSQTFMNPIWSKLNMIKTMMGPIPLDKMYRAIAGNWFSCSASKDQHLTQRIINQALRFYPAGKGELCTNASCHRCSFVFGRLWNHDNLNEPTHRQIDRFFGGVNLTLLHLLMRQGRLGHVMNNGEEALTTVANVERLRGLPMMLFVGSDNKVLVPESTERTYSVLCDAFGSSDANGRMQYKRRVVPGYGHLDCWIGRYAWRDVYPFVREDVDSVTRGHDYKFVEPDDKFKKMVHGGELLP